MSEKNLEQRIEERFYDLGRRIAEFDPTHQAASAAKSQVVELKKEFLEFKNETIPTLEALQKNTESLYESISSLSSRISLILNVLEDLKEDKRVYLQKISQLEKNRASDLVVIQDHDRRFQPLVNMISGLEKKNDENTAGLNKNSSILESLALSLKSLPNHQPDIDSIKKEMRRLTLYTQDSFNVFRENLDVVKNGIISSIDKKCSYLQNNIDELARNIEERICSLPKTDPSAFIPSKELFNINHKIESFSLDAKNALLKSNNNEMQNTLNTKKIENIQLVLKQYELAK